MLFMDSYVDTERTTNSPFLPHGRQTMTEAATKFLAANPTQLGSFGSFKLWEHPTRGDEAPIYMTMSDGRLISTGFYDMGEFDLALCEEIAA